MSWDQLQKETALEFLKRRFEKDEPLTGLHTFVNMLNLCDQFKTSTQDDAATHRAIKLLCIVLNEIVSDAIEEMGIPFEVFMNQVNKKSGRAETGFGGDWWKHGREPE